MKFNRKMLALSACTGITVLLVAGCGSGGAETSAAKVDVAAAKTFLSPFHEAPSAFPITEALQKRMPAGTEVVFLKAPTTVAKQQDVSLKAAAAEMGVGYRSIDVGPSAETVNAALDSVVEMKPDVVVDVGVDPVLFKGQLEKLRAAGTVVVAGAIVDGAQYGFDSVLAGTDDVVEFGRVMAAQALLDGNGDVTDLAYYKTPELPFTSEMERGVRDEIKQLCPACELRVVNVPIAQVGTTAPNTIVSDLQAHPRTKAIIASFDEIFLGLPAALDVAGIQVYSIGQAPVETTYQSIAAGTQSATVAWDIDTMMWGMLDQAARQMAGQELPSFETNGLLIKHIVTRADVPQDTAKGWSAFADSAQSFAKLWAR